MFPVKVRHTGNAQELLNFARNHYENFPVISFLIPGKLKADVAAIYWFARTADDIADEGDFSAEDRLARLVEFEGKFNSMLDGKYYSKYHQLLHNTIKSKKLSPDYFTDLLSAFRQDVVKKRYNTYDDLVDYCGRSANPVGRLLLELFDVRDEAATHYSDHICTALQLTNFYQDTKIDVKKGRIYFPLDEMYSFGVKEKSFELMEINDNFKKLVKFSIDRTGELFDRGKKLLPFLKGRFRLEIDWTIRGGEMVLQKIRNNDYNVFSRPKLNNLDFAGILIKSLIS